jgi:hypothetical protein
MHKPGAPLGAAIPPALAAAMAAREAAIVEREAALDEKERALLATAPCGEPGSVAALRWALLLEERRGESARRAALAHDAATLRALLARACSPAQQQRAMTRGSGAGNTTSGDANADADTDAGAVDGDVGPLVQLTAPGCAIWSVQQVQLVGLAQQEQQADMPCGSCCFQR